MQRFPSAVEVARSRRPELPVACIRPHAATRAARFFVDRFPGTTLYAVKANPDPIMLDALYAGGIRAFDVASLNEVMLIGDRFPSARMAFMHPVKSRLAIRRAYFDYGVRDFSLDSHAELDKILTATENARDLGLFVRIAVSNDEARLSLSHKFGIDGPEAVDLLRSARHHAARLGICFHVGSQTMNPAAYVRALERVQALILRAGVVIDVVDVGGGFPARYPGLEPPPLEDYFAAIEQMYEEKLSITYTCDLWCEPGRALVAEATTVLTRVELRKTDTLYLNEGTYGALFDAGAFEFVYPARRINVDRDEDPAMRLAPFRLYGPTCDSIDAMKGPFWLPADIDEGDYIEFDILGAYGMALRTGFNGFMPEEPVIVEDEPVLSAYGAGREAMEREHVEHVAHNPAIRLIGN
jgi:ornithine decarboxylase